MSERRTKAIIAIVTVLVLLGIGGAVWSVQHGGHGNPFDTFRGPSYIPLSPNYSLSPGIKTLAPDVFLSKYEYCFNVRHGIPVMVVVGENQIVHCVLPDGTIVGTP